MGLAQLSLRALGIRRCGVFGATLAAVAIGIAPENYGSAPALKIVRAPWPNTLRRTMDKQPLFNRVMLLWASSRWPGLVSAAERRGLVEGVGAEPTARWRLESCFTGIVETERWHAARSGERWLCHRVDHVCTARGWRLADPSLGLSRTRMARTASEPIRWQVARFFAEQAAGSCVRCRQVHERCGNRVRCARADRRAGRPEIGRPFPPLSSATGVRFCRR